MYKVSVKVNGRWHVYSENAMGGVDYEVERALDKCRIEAYKVELSKDDSKFVEPQTKLLWQK